MEGMTNGAATSSGGSATSAPVASGAGASGGGAATGAAAPPKATQDSTGAPTQGASNGTPAPEQGQASVTEPKRWKLKAHDKEIEIDDLEKLHRLANKGFGADAVLEQAARDRQQAQSIIEAFKDKARLREIMREQGIDPAEFGRETLQEAIERRQLEETNPDKLRAMELERKIQQMEQAQQAREAQLEEERNVAWKNEQAKHLNDTFIKAMAAVGLKEPTGEMIRRMGKAALAEMRLTGQRITPEAAIESYFEGERDHVQEHWAELPDEKLSWIVGDTMLERCAKIYAAKVKTQLQPTHTPSNDMQHAAVCPA
jgi:hypothetical protein